MTNATPLRALLASLILPASAFAQPTRVVVPVEGGALGGGSFQGVRTPGGTMAPAPSFVNPAVSVIPSAQANLPNISPTVSNSNVRAAMADPRSAAAMPASAFVSPAQGAQVQSAAPAGADAKARPAAAPRQEAPGALPTFDDPARRTPEGGEGSAAGNMAKDLDKAKKDDAKNPGALGVRLDAMFDFSKARGGSVAQDPQAAAASQMGAPSVAGLPDPKAVGVEPVLGKLSALARTADPAEAPALYARAADVAQAGLPAGEAAARVWAMRVEAAKRAPKAVQALAEKALSAASQGRTTDAIRYAKSVHGWDAVVGAPGRPYVENLAEFTGTVKHVLAKALAAPGQPAAAPKVRFEASPSARSALPAAVRARFKFASEADGPVTALPASLAASLALPEMSGFVALDGPEAPAGPELSAAFTLRPEAGFGTLFRAARAAKGSVWSAFWVAARAVVSEGASTVWEQLKAIFVRLLQAVGVLHSAVPAGPVVLAADPAALAQLRSLEPERVERPALPGAPDALGLGYTLVGSR